MLSDQGSRARGYFGIGIEHGKTEDNLGGLWRSAHAFGASFIFTIGARYPRRDATDTTKAWRHIPLFEFATSAAFLEYLPQDVELIGVENARHCQTPRPLPSFTHPERVAYVLGSEDRGLSDRMQDHCGHLVEIPTTYCVNVATAGALVMYDRAAKAAAPERNDRPQEAHRGL